MSPARNIPTVDLDDYTSGDGAARSRMIGVLGDGLREFGFLNVEGHGIDASLIQGTYELWRRFFKLPDDAKLEYAGIEGGAVGYTPFGVEHAKDSPLPDLKEFWHVGQEAPEGHPLRRRYPGNVWPAEIPEIQQPTLRLYKSLERVAENLLRALAEYFDMPRDTFSSMMDVGNSVLRIIHYPPVVPEHAPAVRAAAHEDINLITLLCEATDSGLEILTREGEWMAVESGPGQIVVDAGDMLSRFTNETVPATTHRVVNPAEDAARDRYSMPFFVHPYPDCDLTIPERFVSAENPPKHPPITAGELLDRRLREIGLKQ